MSTLVLTLHGIFNTSNLSLRPQLGLRLQYSCRALHAFDSGFDFKFLPPSKIYFQRHCLPCLILCKKMTMNACLLKKYSSRPSFPTAKHLTLIELLTKQPVHEKNSLLYKRENKVIKDNILTQCIRWKSIQIQKSIREFSIYKIKASDSMKKILDFGWKIPLRWFPGWSEICSPLKQSIVSHN